VQQLTNNLNCLINENNKLKGQVDTSRNSRVIYSNIYKDLEKEIHKHEYLYKSMLIEELCYQEAETKIKDKLEKTVKGLEKDIYELDGGSVQKRKAMKKKSRIDTGLSTVRSTARV
jgi:L-2-hydroxyglutarate oxidase LhgO